VRYAGLGGARHAISYWAGGLRDNTWTDIQYPSVSMRFKVYPLRYRGRRLAWREVINGPSYIGDLRTHEVTAGDERFTVATLFPDDPASQDRLPPLYEPVFAGIAPLAMRLRGFERIERGRDSFAVVQEWHCERPS